MATACLALGLGISHQAKAGVGPEPEVDFNRDIRPILSRNCFACHGRDEEHRAAKLRLDQRDSALAELEDGARAIVPGDPESSELIFRITEEDETVRMPPKKAGGRLRPDEIERIRRWIAQGAAYANHWAYEPPKDRPLPEVRDRSWPRNGIDFWVLARLEAEGLRPSEPADRFTLLRRASLDLRGLPPSPSELESFAKDASADAYEQAVERFLDDPAYGERWARMWLDLARYADSAGYGSDPLRPNMWRYRDWVIDAFNRNLPFDQFTIEQLAGDLLPDATLEQRIATAFHRNTMTNTEGGTDDEEFRVAAIKDRVDTTGQVWLGLTIGCAKCHSHKYEPISQKEYYQVYALFNQTADTDKPDEQPVIPAPTPEIQEAIQRIDAQVAALKARLDVTTPEIAAAQATWEESLRKPPAWTVLDALLASKAESGATLKALTDRSILVEGTNPVGETYTIEALTSLKAITAVRLEAIPDPSLPQGGSGRGPDGGFVLSHLSVQAEPSDDSGQAPTGRYVRVELPGNSKMLSLAEVQVFSGGKNVALAGKAEQSSTDFDGPPNLAIDGNTDGRYAEAKSTTHTRVESNPWWQVTLAEPRAIDRISLWNRTDGGLGSRLANARVLILDDARKVVWQTDLPEPPDPSRDLSPSGKRPVTLASATADLSQQGFAVADVLKPADPNTGWAVEPQQTVPHQAVFVAREPVSLPVPCRLTIRLEHRFKDPGKNLGRFRLSVTDDPAAIRRAEVPPSVLAILDTPAEKRTPEQMETLARHYRSIAPVLKPIRDEIARLEKSKPDVPSLPVMVELPPDRRRETRLLMKGNFLSPGEVVEPNVPAFLNPMPEGASNDRLGLARWLVAPDNPLTARVAVNRFWSQLFGTGLVETEEDFGTQGDLPSHPELLDWLAREYVRSGWDTKALLRLMVTSATYRQSSRVTPERLQKDPRNRLLSRGPRFRLEAEMVRDQALAISGLLSRKVGGPSVFPVQPEGLWQAAFNGQRTWSTSKGDDRYRRGLYTFWRRTVPYPSMAAFDAPSREICTVKRTRTNTPLQAFVTLNDPVFVEAAQALARRIVREGGASVEDRVRYGLLLSLGRPPSSRQVEVLTGLFESERARYQSDAQKALALATEPLGPLPEGMDPAEMAAWTTVANVLLNLDGVLTKG